MLQVVSNCYDLAVHKKIEILGSGIVIFWPPKNSVKTGIQIILLLVSY